MLVLRALIPQTEQHLFRQAYEWRKSPRRDRVAFEVFAADDPRQIVMGLFRDDDFLAVYVFYQLSPTQFDAHFTSSRKAEKRDVLAGASQLVQWFQENGLEIVAYVSERNAPLCRFVEEAGLMRHSDTKTALQPACYGDTVSPTSKPLLEYRSGRVNTHRIIG